ncbi:hypothetical protein BJY04DRAFT_216478 [Aspergillus karnatakaensis]|uniref:uncharacterized protein n=1 Tax=Aspergillus karnatakaensis TaxID=1810916 RepID=UPI003CCD35C2
MFILQDTNRFQEQRQDSGLEVQRPEPANKNPSQIDGNNSDTVRLNSIPGQITQSVNDRAIEYFIRTHTFRDDGATRGFYEYLSSCDIRFEKGLLTTLTAAALAAFGNRYRQGDILKRARHYYGRSLRLVNRALQCPVKAQTDGTMISILLLNTFEGLTSEGKLSMAYSDGHMRGELMIMNLRGPSLVATRQGLQVFLHMGRCLISYCTIQSLQVPEEVIELRKHAARFLDTSDPAWVLEETMIKLAKFRADVKNGGIHCSQSIVNIALQIEDELLTLSNQLPSGRRFEFSGASQEWKGQPLTYHRVYPDPWIAYIWNYTSSCRLLLHQEIQNQLAMDSNLMCRGPQPCLQSSLVIRQMVLDICASVPQYCGELSEKATRRPESSATTGFVPSPVPTIAGVYFLVWPLMTAGATAESNAFCV